MLDLSQILAFDIRMFVKISFIILVLLKVIETIIGIIRKPS